MESNSLNTNEFSFIKLRKIIDILIELPDKTIEILQNHKENNDYDQIVCGICCFFMNKPEEYTEDKKVKELLHELENLNNFEEFIIWSYIAKNLSNEDTFDLIWEISDLICDNTKSINWACGFSMACIQNAEVIKKINLMLPWYCT